MNNKLAKALTIVSHKSEEADQYLRYFTNRSTLPNRRFLIVCDYRSGSTLLANLLNQHPDVYCDGEIFIPFVEHKLHRIIWPYGYLQGKLSATAKPVYGFDCKVDQIMAMGINPRNTASSFFKKLNQEGWHFIYLRRLNIVRQSLSNHIAITRRQWHDRPEEPLLRRQVK